MDRLLLGDNQFFGVNHMSEEKARAQAMRFQDIEAVIDVIDIAIEEQIGTFMCTTHGRVEEICNHVRAQPERYAGFSMMPCMPYAHKYANAVTEHGILGAMGKLVPGGGVLDSVVRGGLSIARKDLVGMISLLVDAEMNMFRGLRTPVIFLQNVVTDFLLGLGFEDAFRIFADYVTSKYDAEPGYITMNMPMLLGALERVGVKNPIVCANINKIGFRMSGGLGAYEEALRDYTFRPIAMSVFASGAIAPEEALDWVCRQPKIEAIVFGASSRNSIRGTRRIVERHWGSLEREAASA